jgi:hypothetical protein
MKLKIHRSKINLINKIQSQKTKVKMKTTCRLNRLFIINTDKLLLSKLSSKNSFSIVLNNFSDEGSGSLFGCGCNSQHTDQMQVVTYSRGVIDHEEK